MNSYKRKSYVGDDNNTKRVNNTVSKIANGELNKVYPILKPGDWEGIKYGAVYQILLGTVDSPGLVVGYGYDTPTNFIFITHSMLGDKTVSWIYEEAANNLAILDAPLNEVAPGKVIFAGGGDFSNEKILDTTFMLSLQKRLHAKALIVSIPRRRNMMVMALYAEPEIQIQFMTVHEDTWNDDSYGNALITNEILMIIDGVIEN